ncbi:hypothetical protein [Pararhodonellum marinum]|uniref:hypothetical protein n=1 Tax=Pararhodonellum marinum TaxID=2755358 RepID=UPI00188F05E7|nr:hypothetical protein [Pararhodonellum marinum]
MKEKYNTSLHTLSFILVVGFSAWALITGEYTFQTILVYLLIAVAFLEMISLYMVGRTYPESHTTFKIGIIATFLILIGIKSMLPSFFVPLSVTALAINFLYNFYANTKRQKGSFKRKANKKLKL